MGMDQTTDAAAESSSAPGETQTDTPAVEENHAPDIVGAAKRLVESQKEAAKPAAAAPEKPAADVAAAGEKKADDEGLPPSRKAFEKRISQINAKAERERARADELSVKLERAIAALELVQTSATRQRQAHEAGEPFDAASEGLHERELALAAQERAAEIQRKHEAELQKRVREAQVEQLRDQLELEMETALSVHDLVSQDQIIAAAKRPENATKNLVAIAKEIEDQILTRARGRLVQPAPPAPRSVGVRHGGNTSTAIPLNEEGLAERLRQLQSQNT